MGTIFIFLQGALFGYALSFSTDIDLVPALLLFAANAFLVVAYGEIRASETK